jgi:hypothetical protein
MPRFFSEGKKSSIFTFLTAMGKIVVQVAFFRKLLENCPAQSRLDGFLLYG